MPLAELQYPLNPSEVPGQVAALLREADARIERFLHDRTRGSGGYVPSDAPTVYHALRAIVAAKLAPGNLFCEWGSGFGVVASLAALLGFDACGIESERELVEASRRLAEHAHLPVEFVHGSFIPPGCEAAAEEAYADNSPEYFRLATHADDAYEQLGYDPCDFDVVFAYPWPGEVCLIEQLFEERCAVGALLVTYDQLESVMIQRNVCASPMDR